jgi:hypothetical protein
MIILSMVYGATGTACCMALGLTQAADGRKSMILLHTKREGERRAGERGDKRAARGGEEENRKEGPGAGPRGIQ